MKKKGMRNKDKDKDIKPVEKKESVLVQLYNNKMLCSKVDNAIEEGMTLEDIVELCEAYDFSISVATLSRYKKKREEAILNGWDLGEYLDKRKKTNVVDIKEKEKELIGQPEFFDVSVNKTRKLLDDIAFLDALTQKAFNGIEFIDTVDPALGIKSIETKAKITNNEMQGISLMGLRELQTKQVAKDSALTQVIMEYIPEEKHEEVLERIEEVEKEFYKNLDLDEKDRQLKEALDRVNYSI